MESKLIRKYKYTYADYELINQIKVASPVFRVPLEIVMQHKKSLNVIEEFCLRLINGGITDAKLIAELLGINEKAVYTSIAKLIDYEAVQYTKKKDMVMTKKGKEIVEDLKTVVPTTIDYTFSIDGITGAISIDDYDLCSFNEIKKEGLKRIDIQIAAPNLESIEFRKVKKAIREYNSNPNKVSDELEGDLLAINTMDAPYLKYKYVDLLVYRHKCEPEVKILAFEKGTKLVEYSSKISKAEIERIICERTIENEELQEPHKSVLINSINKEFCDKMYKDTERYNCDEKELVTKENELDRASLDNIQTKQIEILRKRVDELKNLCENLPQNRVVYTYEHRGLLIQALQNAKEMVVIISPWIRRPAFDNELEELVHEAIYRGVKVHIGYGICDINDGCDNTIIKRLEDFSLQHSNFKLINLAALNQDTHEKVLICDKQFMVITSFNWLSFCGKREWKLRNETGYYIEDKEQINGMINNIGHRMNIKIVAG